MKVKTLGIDLAKETFGLHVRPWAWQAAAQAHEAIALQNVSYGLAGRVVHVSDVYARCGVLFAISADTRKLRHGQAEGFRRVALALIGASAFLAFVYRAAVLSIEAKFA